MQVRAQLHLHHTRPCDSGEERKYKRRLSHPHSVEQEMLFVGRSNDRALPSIQYLTQTVSKAESREAATVETFKAEQKGKSRRGKGPVEELPQLCVILGEQVNSASSDCPQLCPANYLCMGGENRQQAESEHGESRQPCAGHGLFLK